ncbi:ribosome small subunit-dependent GTPase A [Micrococcales bacterium 31B]|nr:ribosome small subunit-dependent GTPase A [Micrococcales bacterium 31B]
MNSEPPAALGWADGDDAGLLDEPGTRLARVVIMHGASADVLLAEPSALAELNVGLSAQRDVTPVAGDWVAVTRESAQIVRVGARRTTLARPSPDGRGTQVIAANIDTILIAEPIDHAPSPGAIERMRILARESGATPVLVLTKADACPDVEGALAEVALAALGIDTHVTSVVDGRGLAELRRLLAPGTTATMLGASGAGKTSLLNALLGTDETTREVRADGQGRHTTTTRRLYAVPGGGAILDVPGVRSLDLLGSESSVDEAYADVLEFATRCRFADCAHERDAGCAVHAAIATGHLDEDRFARWRRAQREVAYQIRRTDYHARQEELRVWKQRSRGQRARFKRRH